MSPGWNRLERNEASAKVTDSDQDSIQRKTEKRWDDAFTDVYVPSDGS